MAGPPPPGQTFVAPPIPSVVHDRDWYRDLRNGGWQGELFDDIDELFDAEAVWS